MTPPLAITAEQLGILRLALRSHLPPGTAVYVFGSRARGGARRYSDLDLALTAERPLDPDVMAEVAEALSESDLPYRVDLVDLALVEPAFRDRIMREAAELTW